MNGDFYVQKITPVTDIRPMPPYDKEDRTDRVLSEGQLSINTVRTVYQTRCWGSGSLAYQAWISALQDERIRKTLLAIYRNNFKHEFWQHANTQRIYAANDDKGLLLCSWPNGGRPALPFVYSDEVWTGIEYQVAAHLIYRGLLDEGLAIVKAISDRYDGVRRNPWDQIEWGHHYTRAMASYSVFLALTGFRYSAVEGSLISLHAWRQGSFAASLLLVQHGDNISKTAVAGFSLLLSSSATASSHCDSLPSEATPDTPLLLRLR